MASQADRWRREERAKRIVLVICLAVSALGTWDAAGTWWGVWFAVLALLSWIYLRGMGRP